MIKRYHTSAGEYFYSGQIELRTPPSDWTTVPSPRLFGLDFDAWALPPSPVSGECERLKEFG